MVPVELPVAVVVAVVVAVAVMVAVKASPPSDSSRLPESEPSRVPVAVSAVPLLESASDSSYSVGAALGLTVLLGLGVGLTVGLADGGAWHSRAYVCKYPAPMSTTEYPSAAVHAGNATLEMTWGVELDTPPWPCAQAIADMHMPTHAQWLG